QDKGLQEITYISNESYDREKQIIEMITYGFVDGVLIAPSEETQKKKQNEHFKELLEYELPVVFYDRINFDLAVDKIGVDDKGSISDAVALMGEKGIDKIGHVSAIHHLDVGNLRIEGYREAISNLKLSPYIATDEEVESL